jgi:hypothetical protein
MSDPPLRIFLHSGGSELRNFLEQLASRLGSDHRLPVAARILPEAPEALSLAARAMEEGDALVSLSLKPLAQAEPPAALRTLAAERKVRLFPFLLTTDPVAVGGEAMPVLPDRPRVRTLEAQGGAAMLGAEIARNLFELLLLSWPETDLLIRPIPSGEPPGTPDPLRAHALTRLQEAGQEGRGQLPGLARENRVQAALAIRARLPEVALEALERAVAHEATSAISHYWIARLLASRNLNRSLEDGLRAATRAIRLARLRGDDPVLELAAARLAARLCALMGDRVGMEAHFATAAPLEPSHEDLQLDKLQLYQRAGFPAAAREQLEILYSADRRIADRLLDDPEGVPFRAHLQILHEREEARLRHLLKSVWEAERALADARQLPLKPLPMAPPDPADEVLDWLGAKLRQSLDSQLQALNAWGVELIEAARDLRDLRQDLRTLAGANRTMPARGELDALLERLWPRLRARYRALGSALAETDRLTRELAGEEAATRDLLAAETERFAAFALAFESLLGRHPELLPGPAEEAPASLRDLALLGPEPSAEPSGELRRHDALWPADLAEALEEIPSPVAEVGLYRLERSPHGAPLASRMGVYFEAARRRFQEP